MHINISVRLMKGVSTLDLSIDERQKIKEVFRLLKEKEIIKEIPALVRALKVGHVVDTDLTFKEAGIYSGELIEVI